MKKLRNKSGIICKKFLYTSFIALFIILESTTFTSFASIGGSGNTYTHSWFSLFSYFSAGGNEDGNDGKRPPKGENISTNILDLVYPVGSIYMSVNDVNPANIFGGVWERWGAGRVPVGVNATQSEFSTSERTGGSRTHTHTLDSAAAMIGSDWGRTDTLAFSARNVGNLGATTYVLQTHNRAPDARGRSHNTALTGTTNTSANLQPYITCYMWKRIA